MAEAQPTVPSVWERATDYLLGRNALIGLASMMLLAISGYATWSGMHDFIIGVSSSQSRAARELFGVVSISDGFFVAAIVVSLTFLMWLSLRESFGAQRRFTERLITFPLYLFLALWSIGFGYGFWWSLIAGEDATRSSLSTLREEAENAALSFAGRLEAVQGQLDNVANWSSSQMAREEAGGGTCGVPSGAGRGSLYHARRSIRDSVAVLHDGITHSWLTPMQAELQALRQGAAGLGTGTIQERQQFFEAQASEIRIKARSIAARSNELGISTAAELRALASAVSIEPKQVGFTCFDPTLAQLLHEAGDQAAHSAELRLPAASFNEGPAGVANAVKNLWQNVGAYAASMAHYIASGARDSVQQTKDGEPITGRDLIALLATLGIDLGILALALLNPPGSVLIRRDGLATSQARLHLPTASVVRHLTSAIETAMARAPGVDFEWVRRHFVHHDRASYFVIPNLYSVDQANSEEELRALAMNHLAGVFDDLKLVRTLSTSELKHFGREELRDSYSDLSPFREHAMGGEADQPINPLRRLFATSGHASVAPATHRTRNHGLLSKAQRALDIAGWSAGAQRDVEIFRLVTTGGLTPLLTVLNEGALAKANERLISRESLPSSALEDLTPLNKDTTRSIPMLEHRRAS